MAFSISDSTPFSSINWDSFEGRPSIDLAMPFCTEADWDDDRKCCMDGYAIEHVRDMAYDNGAGDTVEARFLDQYPCVNGPELDHFVERFTSGKPATQTDSLPKSRSIWEAVSRMLSAVGRQFGCGR